VTRNVTRHVHLAVIACGATVSLRERVAARGPGICWVLVTQRTQGDPMKKVSKLPHKLALHSETVRTLSTAHLVSASGGIPPGPPTYALGCTFGGGGICPEPLSDECMEC
jgi:hypothetical protein